MTRDNYLKELESLEEVFASESFVFDNVDWWVLIKIQIASQLHSQLTNTNSTKNQLINKTSKASKITIKDRVKFFLVKIKFNKFDNNIAVFTHSANRNTIDSNGKVVNQYTDPFLDCFSSQHLSFDLFNLSSIQKEIENYNFIKTFYYNRVSLKFKEDILFQEKLQKIELYFDQRNIFNFSIYNRLKNVIIDGQAIYQFYNLFFKKQNYKSILYYCYYSQETMAINRAAKENGIKTVEYQHSLISNYHFAYSGWTNRIFNCESFFPSVIWVWGNEFKTLLDENFKMLKNFTTLVAGNVYNRNLKSEVNIKKNSDKINVLITLQGVGLPKFIQEFILSNDKYFWFVRFHPRYPMDKPEILDLIGKKSNNIEIEIANESSLQEMFEVVDYHLTSFSGTAIEADYFKVKNLIFGEDGYLSYQSKIESGEYYFIDSIATLKSTLNARDNLRRTEIIDIEIPIEETIRLLFGES